MKKHILPVSYYSKRTIKIYQIPKITKAYCSKIYLLNFINKKSQNKKSSHKSDNIEIRRKINIIPNNKDKNNKDKNNKDKNNKDKNNIKNLDDSENEVDDTLRCETLKNAFQGTEKDLTENKNISKKFSNNNHNEGRSPANKNKNKIRLTINNIPLFDKKFKSKEKKAKTNLNSPKPFYHSSTQKTNLEIEVSTKEKKEYLKI
jgi:hypothetical protein